MKDLIGYYFSLSIFVTTRKYVSNGIKTNERRGMLVEKCWPEWPENVHWPDGPLSIHFKWPAGQCLWESLCMTYVVHPVIAVLHIIVTARSSIMTVTLSPRNENLDLLIRIKFLNLF